MVKYKKHNILYLLFFLIISIPCYPQFFSQGENPSSIKWNQINTENFQIIFDENVEESALKVANVLDQVYEYGYDNLKKKPVKISIILQSHITASNGFVTLAPRRSEFYTTAPQDNDVIDWLGLLAIHEFRHVVQIDKLNQGLTKIASFLLGEQAQGFLFGLTTPLWFMEGDAVGTETALTNAGRGRLPSFEMGLRTQLLTRGAYTYNKASFGSFKDIVPNQYPFGYFMTTYVKNHYGREVWGDVLNRVGRNPLMPFRFSTALKKEIGMGTGKLYKAMIHELDSLWKNQVFQLTYTDFITVNTRKKRVPLNYSFPKAHEGNVIYAVKEGFSQVPVFVQLDSLGNEKNIYQPINYNKSSFFSNGKQLVWTETRPDIRWEYRDFSDVKILDIETKKVQTFLKKTKLFYPTLNPEGTSLAAIDYNQVGACQLTVYDIESRERYFIWLADWDEEIKNPSWLNNEEIIFVHYTDRGNALMSINIQTQKLTTYTDYEYIQMRNPTVMNNHIYFDASYSGIQNIYVVDIETKNMYQVTSSQYGAFQPHVFNNQLYYSNYTNLGYDIVHSSIDQKKWIPIKNIENQSIQYYKQIIEQEGNVNLLDSIPSKRYEVTKYHKWKHLVNLHSWQPFSLDENDDYKPLLGVELKSQNKLSSTILHYRYQNIPTQNLNKHELDITYNAFFPKITLTPYHHKYKDLVSSTGEKYEEVKDQGLKLNLNLPLRFVGNHFYHVYIPFVQGRWTKRSIKSENLGEGSFTYAPIEMGFTTLLASPQAKRDIVTKWLLRSTLLYGHTIDQNFDESNLYFKLQGNVPSLFKHHVISTEFIYEQGGQNLFLSNRLRLPRGYQSHFILENSQALFLNYIFPIAYPDVGLGFLAYFQRIKANVFFDYVQSTNMGNLYSYGTEITFDMNALRYSYMLDLGVRISKPKGQNIIYEPMINVSF